MRISPALFAMALIAWPLPGLADNAVEGSRRVVEKQIEAFLRDDAAAAYAFAAPGIQARYPDKDSFFDMVKKSYQPVYKPGNYAFGRTQTIDDGAMVLHELLIEGRDGKDWKAVYQLLRQPDGSYRIGGVAIVPETDTKGI
ncbi:MAG: DUF4864 domain-containing protein [Rhizobium sp.]|nr:DUF4864 domain-containing protein [Rhizobium sp.]